MRCWLWGTDAAVVPNNSSILAEHPDPEVRQVLVDVLESYRGRAAQILRERVIASLQDDQGSRSDGKRPDNGPQRPTPIRRNRD